MQALELANRIVTPEFDYNYLMNVLQEYRYPKDCVTKLLKKGLIIRVKKGIYVFGHAFHRPYTKGILANMIYGPSYVSGVSALSTYGLIPEKVTVTTSSTPNRKKYFNTPVGDFEYRYLPMQLYRVSVTTIKIDQKRSYLIATQEKALVEELVQQKTIKTATDVQEWLQAMRIEADNLAALRLPELHLLHKCFLHQAIEHLIQIIEGAKKSCTLS